MVSDARFLLVPLGKIPLPGTTPSPSTDLDHYKCYAAGGIGVNLLPFLSDEFIGENTTVLWPVLFCNPVLKIHGSSITNIQNNRDHLTCYATTGTGFPGILNPWGRHPEPVGLVGCRYSGRTCSAFRQGNCRGRWRCRCNLQDPYLSRRRQNRQARIDAAALSPENDWINFQPAETGGLFFARRSTPLRAGQSVISFFLAFRHHAFSH